MLDKFEHMTNSIDAGSGERDNFTTEIPSMDELREKMRKHIPDIYDTAELHSDAGDNTNHKELPRNVMLEDGTLVELPYPDVPLQQQAEGKIAFLGSEKTLDEIFAPFGYNDKEMTEALMVSGIDRGRDLFSEFGIDLKEVQNEVPSEPKIKSSAELDFWESFDEFTDEDLYSHGFFNERSEFTREEGPNCMAYAYGVSREIDGSAFEERPGPGHFAGLDTSSELQNLMRYGSPDAVKKTFEKYMKMDFDALGKEFLEVGSNDYQPKSGERMFALVTAPDIPGVGSDFHFYVKGENGYWSHKPGVTNPTIFDHGGDTIRDPQQCERGFYTNFVGFYVVKDK